MPFFSRYFGVVRGTRSLVRVVNKPVVKMGVLRPHRVALVFCCLRIDIAKLKQNEKALGPQKGTVRGVYSIE